MSAARILAELRDGPRTTSELAASAGVSRNAVLCAVYGLTKAGHRIVNDTPKGRADGRYRLVYDCERPAPRSCLWPGCNEPLNRYNPGPYCLAHRRRLARVVLASWDAYLDRHAEVDDEQLELVAALP